MHLCVQNWLLVEVVFFCHLFLVHKWCPFSGFLWTEEKIDHCSFKSLNCKFRKYKVHSLYNTSNLRVLRSSNVIPSSEFWTCLSRYFAHGTATDFMYDVVGVPMAFTFEVCLPNSFPFFSVGLFTFEIRWCPYLLLYWLADIWRWNSFVKRLFQNVQSHRTCCLQCMLLWLRNDHSFPSKCFLFL